MVLESLINPKKAVNKPKHLFFLGFIYATAAIFVSLWIFKSYLGLNTIVLTTFAVIPLMYYTLRHEEKKEMKMKDERAILQSHSKILTFFIFLFLGCVVAFALWNTLLPAELSDSIFAIQKDTITQVNENIVGNAISTTSLVTEIFTKNMKVLFFCLALSFLYGFGAAYIIIWNASVIGTAVGEFVRANMATGYAAGLSLGLVRYLLHGIPEIAGFFLAGLAGSLLSMFVIRKDYFKTKGKRVIKDVVITVFLAALLLLLGAVTEVYITPLFF